MGAARSTLHLAPVYSASGCSENKVITRASDAVGDNKRQSRGERQLDLVKKRERGIKRWEALAAYRSAFFLRAPRSGSYVPTKVNAEFKSRMAPLDIFKNLGQAKW